MANPKSKIVKPLLTKELKKLFNDATDGLYHIEYSKFDMDINSSYGSVTAFKLIPDSAVLKKLIANHKAPNSVFNISAEKLIISKFGFVKTKTGRKFKIGTIVMNNPTITLTNKRRKDNVVTGPGKPSEPIKMVKDILKTISIKSMTVKHLNFTLVNQNDGTSKVTRFKNLTIKVSGFTADSPVNNNDGQKSNNSKAHGLKVNWVSISTPDSLYHINFRDITLAP